LKIIFKLERDENKMYKTEQRKELIEYMKKNSNIYVSAEDILKHLKNKNINIGLTTVYRFLKTIEEQGKVRVELREHTKFYQYIKDECEAHYHLKCEECGKLIHFHCEELEQLTRHISKEHKFKIDTKSVIYGKCEECINKEVI